MRRSRVIVWCLACVLLAGAGLQAAELKIAVLDVQRTLLAYERRASMRAELDKRKKQISADLTHLDEELKSRQSDLDSMKPGTESYRQFQLKLIELEAHVETQRRRFELEFELLQRTNMQTLYEDVVKELELYAKENSIDLVLTKYLADARIGGPHPIVLFAASSFDITEPIINRLNAKVPAQPPGAAPARNAQLEAGPRKDALK